MKSKKECENMERDKIKGYIYGSAYGDALGQPLEFLNGKEIIKRYGEEGLGEPLKGSNFTDDTKMMIAVAKGILKVRNAELDIMMNNVAQEFIQWLDDTGIAPGTTCLSACRNLQAGISWAKSGIVNSKGCGSAMRSGIIGLLFDNKKQVKEIAHIVGEMTHGHPEADAAAQAAALLVFYAKTGIEVSDYPSLLNEDIGGIGKNFDNLVELAVKLSREDSMTDSEALSKIGEGWTGDEAVTMALYTIMKYPNDYKKVIRTVANITGDSDSIAAIAGGIMGVRVGYERLPTNWLEKLQGKDELVAFSEFVERSMLNEAYIK